MIWHLGACLAGITVRPLQQSGVLRLRPLLHHRSAYIAANCAALGGRGMLQLRCLPVPEKDHGTNDQVFLLELAIDPARLLLTLNVCRLMMPPDTDPLHIENWGEIESLVRQLSTIYQQACPHHPALSQRRPRRRVKAQQRPPED
jgi:hypothetical protein